MTWLIILAAFGAVMAVRAHRRPPVPADDGPVTQEIPAVRAAPRPIDPWEQAAWAALLGPRRTTTDPIECAEQWRQQLGDER